ncbi:hypothetical protein MK805_14410 [Shimazuella sp. AN120528]|uniref:hypothetical protein n=1 Tax=Shimazuella soli TaxID=1892854 RepID=UPI001F106AB6|nr:hypothetical protein [Shimazuella soli]MCH5586131.1 hypothetical protein [Shimazuella soli]
MKIFNDNDRRHDDNERRRRRRRRFRREVIRLRPGETATRTCGTFSGRTITVRLRRGEVLVAVCRSSRRIFIFVCGRPRFTRTITLRRGTRIVVSCRRT